MAEVLSLPCGRRACARVTLWSCVFVAAFGCGRPATVEDCQQIVARIAELELKEVDVASQAEVKSQIQGAQVAFHDRLMTDCVGRRLRQGTLSCLNKATSAESAVKECF